MPKDLNELEKSADKAREYFYQGDAHKEIYKVDELIKNIDNKYIGHANTFKNNITNAISVLDIPFHLAVVSVKNRLYTELSIVESVRYQLGDKDYKSDPDNDVHKKTVEKLKEHFEEDKDNILEIGYKAFDMLLNTMDSNIENSSRLLMNQGLVLFWGFFETLAKDLIVTHINNNPNALTLISNDSGLRNKVDIKKVSLDNLIENDFDLSSKMGSLICRDRNFSDIELIKQFYNALFPESAQSREILSNKDLWLMLQQRHLVAHSSGIVDEIYLKKTKDNLEIGAFLCVKPKQLNGYIKLIIDAGCALIESTINKDETHKQSA